VATEIPVALDSDRKTPTHIHNPGLIKQRVGGIVIVQLGKFGDGNGRRRLDPLSDRQAVRLAGSAWLLHA